MTTEAERLEVLRGEFCSCRFLEANAEAERRQRSHPKPLGPELSTKCVACRIASGEYFGPSQPGDGADDSGGGE